MGNILKRRKQTVGPPSLSLKSKQILPVPAVYKAKQDFLDLGLIKHIFPKQFQRTEEGGVKVHSGAIREWNGSPAGRHVTIRSHYRWL